MSPRSCSTRSSASFFVATSRATMILFFVMSSEVETSLIYSMNSERFLDFARNDRKITPMQVFAPAKINLSLKIFGRRDDGFHEIETLIAPISLYDEIRIDKGDAKEGIEFCCDDPSVPKGYDNLAVRAAKAFFAGTKIDPAISIELKKKIPHGAGLGGGSSDAASVLLALNELFETKLPREALAKMAEAIGSDVPFFIFQSAAMCKGRGELVTLVKLKEKLPILLLKPAFVVSTAWAYSRWQHSQEIWDVRYTGLELAGQIV